MSCSQANLTIIGASSLISSPTLMQRSRMFSIRATVNFVCSLSFSIKFNWNIFKWNAATNLFELIDISNSTNTLLAELAIKSNTLPYGIYTFNSIIDIIVNDTNMLREIKRTNQGYLRIIDSGIIVYALPNGVLDTALGNLQSLDLNPTEYSYDIDNLIDIKQLRFKFYCLVNPNKFIWQTGLNYPRINTTVVDLYQFKILNDSQLMNENTTCFNSPSMSFTKL
jgi:hypothetical protein